MMTEKRLRNLDLGTLRSFVLISETASVTRAATRLAMTQSAISMQIKRLETSLGLTLFERTARGMVVTSAGERLLGFALRLLEVNDEAVGRLTALNCEGQVRLGVPSHLFSPHIPDTLKRFSRDYPKVHIKLSCAQPEVLKQQLGEGVHDVIVTTETNPARDSLVVGTQQLMWTGAVDGNAWKQQPIPLGMTKSCSFWPSAVKALDAVGLDWVDLVSSEDVAAGQAMTAADLCVAVELGCAPATGRKPIDHRGRLPELPDYSIVVHQAPDSFSPMMGALVGYLQRGYA